MSHDHKYFMFETKAAFEPYIDDIAVAAITKESLYTRVEYAILACNCGDVIKRKIKSDIDLA